MSLTSAERTLLAAQMRSQQAELRAMLDQRQQAAATVELDQTRVGRLSRMDALQGQAMAQASAERARVQLGQIDAALARIDRDDFGECEECGEAIATARLALNPAARLCIGCAEAAEGS